MPTCLTPNCPGTPRQYRRLCETCREHTKARYLRKQRRVKQPFCSVAGCPNRHVAKGYCGRHYMHMRRKFPTTNIEKVPS